MYLNFKQQKLRMTAKTKDDVESSIQYKLSSLPKISSNCCIYKVPGYIREVNRECYQPSAVSIGPIHYNNPSLKSSLELKLNYLKCFLELATHTNGNKAYSLSQYIDLVKIWEDEARSYYEEKLSLSSNEFIEMMIIDAAFIIYFFMSRSRKFQTQNIASNEKITWIMKVKQDIFVEDNQLPFFVLNKLYSITFGEAHRETSFEDLTCYYISNNSVFGNTNLAIGKENVVRNTSGVKHLLDFLRIWHLPSKPLDGTSTTESTLPPPSAEKLEVAGVKFKAGEGKHLLDIKFSDGVLEIPRLTMEDRTEGFLRNIIFFEQCHHFNNESYFADYVSFIDALINTREDVQILVQHGVIKNFLGSDDEVANVVNQLCKNIMIHSPKLYYYSDIAEKLNAHANTRRNKWMAILRKDYFNNPWSIISVVYLAILLILTVLQVYTGFKN
ncbi:UPF0481 protein At3g47200-like isoform X2 [Chenopodium quinoa]|uniref:UPF0481 protein At3g47200-like isoform X1 n=1 Tax=Chenopodium quinoa TaxID=63459 RepID=UPI000B789A66|nr:UPF0481 protein At3g47200-like isoform X1 [Chenopodium quinoa]XP_021758174.1 UPF0481 protein At3g47200-like isoform X2 [Chenopodium quinoa]